MELMELNWKPAIRSGEAFRTLGFLGFSIV